MNTTVFAGRQLSAFILRKANNRTEGTFRRRKACFAAYGLFYRGIFITITVRKWKKV